MASRFLEWIKSLLRRAAWGPAVVADPVRFRARTWMMLAVGLIGFYVVFIGSMQLLTTRSGKEWLVEALTRVVYGVDEIGFPRHWEDETGEDFHAPPAGPAPRVPVRAIPSGRTAPSLRPGGMELVAFWQFTDPVGALAIVLPDFSRQNVSAVALCPESWSIRRLSSTHGRQSIALEEPPERSAGYWRSQTANPWGDAMLPLRDFTAHLVGADRYAAIVLAPNASHHWHHALAYGLDGKLLWHLSADSPLDVPLQSNCVGERTSLHYDREGRPVLLTYDTSCRLMAIDVGTGEIRWRAVLPDEVREEWNRVVVLTAPPDAAMAYDILLTNNTDAFIGHEENDSVTFVRADLDELALSGSLPPELVLSMLTTRGLNDDVRNGIHRDVPPGMIRGAEAVVPFDLMHAAGDWVSHGRFSTLERPPMRGPERLLAIPYFPNGAPTPAVSANPVKPFVSQDYLMLDAMGRVLLHLVIYGTSAVYAEHTLDEVAQAWEWSAMPPRVTFSLSRLEARMGHDVVRLEATRPRSGDSYHPLDTNTFDQIRVALAWHHQYLYLAMSCTNGLASYRSSLVLFRIGPMHEVRDP